MKENLVREYYGNLIKLIDKTKEKHLKREYLIEKFNNLNTSVINSYFKNIAGKMNIKVCDINLTGKELYIN